MAFKNAAKTVHENKASYQQNDDDADIFGVLPELISRYHLGVVNNSKGENEHTQQLHHHGGLKTPEDNTDPTTHGKTKENILLKKNQCKHC